MDRAAEDASEAGVRLQSAGNCEMGWLGEDGRVRLGRVEVTHAGRGELTIEAPFALSRRQLVWLLPATPKDYPARVEDVKAGQGAHHLRLRLVREQRRPAAEPALTVAQLRWVDGAGRLVTSFVYLRKAARGQIEVNVPEPLPVPSLALVSGGEWRCLASVQSCAEAEQGYAVTLELSPRAQQAAEPAA